MRLSRPALLYRICVSMKLQLALSAGRPLCPTGQRGHGAPAARSGSTQTPRLPLLSLAAAKRVPRGPGGRQHRGCRRHGPRLQAVAAAPTTGKSSLQQMDQLLRWCIERHGLPATVLEPAEVEVQGGEGALRLGFSVSRPVEQGEVSKVHKAVVTAVVEGVYVPVKTFKRGYARVPGYHAPAYMSQTACRSLRSLFVNRANMASARTSLPAVDTAGDSRRHGNYPCGPGEGRNSGSAG